MRDLIGILEQGPSEPPVRVLAIDDDPRAIPVLEAAASLANFDFSAATDAGRCLDLAREIEPDVILLDAMMPAIDGFELCRQLKSDRDLRLIPVVLVTALDSREDRIAGLAAGCDDFMSKPVDRAELTARVRSLARIRRMTEKLDDAERVLESLARSVEAKDGTTGDHCDRLKWGGRAFGAYLGLSEPEIKALERGGILHDIGKIGIPDAVLLKPGKLNAEEWLQMKRHPVIGAELLAPLRTMQRVVPIVRHHDERWDGNGYPDGLAGEEIPLLARVFQILDAFDALTSERPYKPAMTAEQSLKTLEQEAAEGKWDPRLLREFLAFGRQPGGHLGRLSRESNGSSAIAQ